MIWIKADGPYYNLNQLYCNTITNTIYSLLNLKTLLTWPNDYVPPKLCWNDISDPLSLKSPFLRLFVNSDSVNHYMEGQESHIPENPKKNKNTTSPTFPKLSATSSWLFAKSAAYFQIKINHTILLTDDSVT